jgi:tripartite-type tricarboxylate transporter receptor subunit TctC
MSHVKSGKLRVVAVAEATRSPLMPDVPTIAETGVTGYEISPEIGFVAPTGTPRDVIAKLNAEMVRALKTPEVVQQLVPLGIDPVGTTPEQYADAIRANLDKYGKLVKISRAKVD